MADSEVPVSKEDNMGRIFITGDKHGDYSDVVKFCERWETTKDDAMIVLGDNGVNYYGLLKDRRKKKQLSKLPITFIMIRGNHDRRPYRNVYQEKEITADQYSGTFLVEEEHPSLLFTKEFGWYAFGGVKTFVIGGAYSVDKWYRLEQYELGYHQYKWFPNEQLSKIEMDEAMDELTFGWPENENVCIMSHTCPMFYKPYDKLIPGIDQSGVDESMEKWLDTVHDFVEEKCSANQTKWEWYCGHWHIDRRIDTFRFMYDDYLSLTKI